MEPHNPYAPPQTNPVAEIYFENDLPLAGRGTRLGAQIIDGLISAVLLIPLSYFTGYFTRVQEAAMQGKTLFGEAALWGLLGMVVYIAIHWTFLQNGQTIGKQLLNIRIVRRDGSPIPVSAIILRRLLPVQAVSLIPYIGGFAVCIDALLIFRKGHNTLHDDIAGTKVVKVG